jgi:phage shock protein A
VPSSKRKIKQQKRRAEKRAKRTEEPSLNSAEELLARIALERRVRHEQSTERFREEQERLWLAEERSRARKGRKVKG